MQMRKHIKKVGALAGSVFMAGATLGFGASLNDFPQPYINDDGEIASQVVVGESAATADVVGGIQIAAELGNNAFTQEERSVSTGSAPGWSVSGDGQILSTTNDNLFLGSALNAERDTLTEDQLSSLGEVTFEDDGGTTTDVEFFLKPGNPSDSNGAGVVFGKPDDRDNQDPIQYVPNPESVDSSAGNYLFQLQANFDQEINFTATDVQDGTTTPKGGGESVSGITLFGQTYDILPSTTTSELVLSGGREEITVETGSPQTVEFGGNTFEISVDAVNDQDTATFTINGQTRDEDEDDTFTLKGVDFRVDEIFEVNSDQNTGKVRFDVGSKELHLIDGQELEDEDGNQIPGTYVELNGGGTADVVNATSTIDIYVGSNDDDHEYVKAGETFSHPQFSDFKFSFGGLNPDTTQGSKDNEDVSKVDFTTSGDDTAQVQFTSSGGDTATVEFSHTEDPADTSNNPVNLADDNNDAITVIEGHAVQEDESVLVDSGDFSHMYQVDSFNVDEADLKNNGASDDEATVTLQDVVTGGTTGDTVDFDLDADGDGNSATNDNEYEDEEVIDGKTYHFVLNTQGTSQTSDDNLYITWGSGADFTNQGNEVTAYPALDLESGSSLAFADDIAINQTNITGTSMTANSTLTYILPSTESTDDAMVDVTAQGNNTHINGSNNQNTAVTDNGDNLSVTVNGGITYNFLSNKDGTVTVAPQTASGTGHLTNATATVIEPEDDNDQEQGYVVTPRVDTGTDEQMEIGTSTATVTYSGSVRNETTLESDDDITAGVDFYGAHTLEDSDDPGSFTVHLPAEQANAGAAFVTGDGMLEKGGSAGSTTVTESTPTEVPDLSMLDSEVTSSVKQNSNLILVGGPAVNTLVADLASQNDNVWSAETWRDGQHDSQAQLVHVEDAFADGQAALVVAGHSAADTRAASRALANFDRPPFSDKVSENTTAITLTSAEYPA